MNLLVLTQDKGKILGPIAKYILGPILNAIFNFLNWIKIPNVGLAIILFTIVIYLLMLPLAIKQQKFSKLQAKMNPELQAIQKKYKDKKDQDSQMAMNQETQAVYAKYGVSPTGSCLQLLIQMPILFALYRVIYAIPAYVPIIKDTFTNVVTSLAENKDKAATLLQSFSSARMYSNQFANELFVSGDAEYVKNTFIDVLNRASTSEWESIYASGNFPQFKDVVVSTMEQLNRFNNFLGINIGNSPSYTVKTAFANHQFLIVIGAILIPVLSAVTQWINVKLTPQASNKDSSGNQQADQMQSSMKAMNTFMPIFSAIMCFTLPAGMGIYWIAGSVVRSIQQVAINKYIDKMDIEEEIKKNVEKRNKRLQKAGVDPSKITANANRSTKTMEVLAKLKDENDAKVKAIREENEAKVAEARKKLESSSKGKNSIAAKANLVKEYNEKNNNN